MPLKENLLISKFKDDFWHDATTEISPLLVKQCQIIRNQIVCIEIAMRAGATIVSLARGEKCATWLCVWGDDRKAEELNMPHLNCIYLRSHIILAKTHC